MKFSFIGTMLFLFGVLGTNSAHAFVSQDVNCLRGGCLTAGWSIYDYQSGQSTLVQCVDGDCLQGGWTQELIGGNGDGYYAKCEEGGCFVNGWQTRIISTDRYVGETRCLPSREPVDEPVENCLINGWMDTPARGPSVTVRCVGETCREQGWQIRLPDGSRARALCKRGNCFEHGWVIEQY